MPDPFLVFTENGLGNSDGRLVARRGSIVARNWCGAILLGICLAGLPQVTRATTRGVAAGQAAEPSTSVVAAGTEPVPATAYTLPPEKLVKAIRLAHARTWLHFGSEICGIAFLVLMLVLRRIAWLRDVAARASRRWWVRGLLFIPGLVLAISIADLPFSMAEHRLSLVYGQSIQGWISWSGDWAKGLGLSVVGLTFLALIVFALIRRTEKRWWLWVWLLSIPLQLLTVFASPYLIDPLFNHFEPLTKSDPALVEQLERVVARSKLEIPPSRMFLMRASDKDTVLNAYVTGFGASKRVVVWDTTIQKCPADEILFIYGHEQGHYALNHVRDGLVFSFATTLLGLWLGAHALRWLVRRYGGWWGISAVADWGSAGVLLLIFAVFSFVSEPIGNALSRVIEHQADVYGQEVVHGLVADPRQTAARAFERLGETSLDEPRPNGFVEFWTYSHPSIGRRVAFAARYDPWQQGQRPRYFGAAGPR